MQKGHWKNECPQRGSASSSASTNSTTTSVAPTSMVITDDPPAEIANFTIVEGEDRPDESSCFMVSHSNQGQGYGHGYKRDNWGKIKGISQRFSQRFHSQWKASVRTKTSSEMFNAGSESSAHGSEMQVAGQTPLTKPSTAQVSNVPTCDVNFATTGTVGIVDLGASQTVIGAHQVKDLIGSLPTHVQKQLQRITCNLTFPFGNHQTPTSRHVL